jgi:S1-C subfamily serine protease
MKIIAIGLTTTLLLAGCASTPIKQVEAQQTIDILLNQDVRPVQFKKVVIKLPRGAKIGATQAGVFCVKQGPLIWRGGKITMSGDEFTEVFREELEKANYPIVGDPDALFDDPSEWKAELLVAGLIKEMQANLCYPRLYYYDYNTCKGEAYVQVNWQIYSRLDRKVVCELNTEGSSILETATTTGSADVFLNAFAMATQNLLANQKFHDLVVRGQDKLVKTDFEKIILKNTEMFHEPLTEHINQTRTSVITVFAGEGHGSGFFINESGYFLTNAHVVGGARFVTVKLVTGRELIGEVYRKDNRLDVALVKVEEENMIPLPIRSVSANIGDEVYVLGTPLKEEFDTTLSKGIISGFREEDGRKTIQSDVNILPGNSGGPLLDENGNVIGLTVSGMSKAGISMGINFFIPINDAMRTLNIELQNEKVAN